MKAGVFQSFVHQVVRAWARFTCFTFHWLVSTGGFFCLFVGFVLLFLIVDQSLRSSYLPMTILAQLRDCHSCYDERSIVQKKNHRIVSRTYVDFYSVLCYSSWKKPILRFRTKCKLYHCQSTFQNGHWDCTALFMKRFHVTWKVKAILRRIYVFLSSCHDAAGGWDNSCNVRSSLRIVPSTCTILFSLIAYGLSGMICPFLSHAVSPRPGLVKVAWRSPTFRHMYTLWPVFHRTLRPVLFGFFWTLCVIGASFSLIECTSCHRYLEPNGFSAPILLFRAPLMTRLRNGSLVSDALFRGGLICFRICLINSLIVLANDCECFCCFSRTWNCPFRVVVADWRANRPGHVP